jgi:hypothetical protein
LTEYVRQAFEEGLAQAAVRQSASSQFEFRVQLDSVDDPMWERGILSSDYYLDIAATVSLLDRGSGKEVWRERIRGRAKIDLAGTFDMGPYFIKTLPSSIADLVSQSLSSASLAKVLRSANAPG